MKAKISALLTGTVIFTLAVISISKGQQGFSASPHSHPHAMGKASVYVIGTNSVPGGFGIHKFNGMGWDPMPGGATEITVDSSGNPWVVNANHEIFRWAGSTWAKAPGSAMDIAGGGKQVYVIGTNSVPGGFGIYRWTPSATWEKLPGGGVRIAVDSSGNPWVVNSANEIFRMVNGVWQKLPGAGLDIGAGGNEVWVIGTNSVPGGYGIYRFFQGGWQNKPGGAVRIDVDSTGVPWVVNSSNQIFKWVGNDWQLLPGSARDIGAE